MAISKIILNNASQIDLTSDTVTADKLLQGYTAHDASGAQITGTAIAGTSYTATVTGTGYSTQCYVQHNNTKYYTNTNTFSFTEGDSLYIYCAGTRNTATIYVNDEVVAGGSEKTASYTLALPAKDIEIYLSFDSSSVAKVNYFESVLVKPLNILVNGTYTASSGTAYSPVTVNVPSTTTSLQSKSATPSESQQTITADSGYDGLSSVTVGAISSTYVGSGITSRSSSDLTVSGATVTAPSGYYESQASKTVASGTAGTPTATKGTVSNHSISITPSVTNTTGYITGSTKTGTAVTVTASELASGNKSISANGTGIDVVGYSTVSVDVEPNLQAKTNISPTTSSQTITADSGYDGLSSVQINAIPTMTLPSSASGTSSGTSKATISRSTSNQYINIPTGYNSTAQYYTISATPNMTLPTAASSTSSGTSKATITPGTTAQYLNIPTGYNGTAQYYTISAVTYSTIRTGTTTPASSLGSNGDVYIKTS